MDEVERAEFNQSLKAYLIPSSLFVACLINSAGIYILYNGNCAGIAFLVVGFATIIWAMVSFVQFQNKQRAAGKFKRATSPEQVANADTSPAEAAERSAGAVN